MSSLWENIRKSIREGVQIAANKTEEMTRIGKFKVGRCVASVDPVDW